MRGLMKKAVSVFMLLCLLCSCRKFNELNRNPNAGTEASPDVILTGVLKEMHFVPWGYEFLSSQFHCQLLSYYEVQSYEFGAAPFYYPALRNINRMVKEASRTGGAEMEPYYALADFLKAWFYISMSAKVGDVPLSQAGRAEDGVFTPVYDSQKSVYQQCLQWLAAASERVRNLKSRGITHIKGDIYYNGDLLKWEKAINAFRLRVLISLSKKAGDADMNVAARFREILMEPLILNNAENLQISYNDRNTENYNPAYVLHPEVKARRSPLGAVLINLFVKLRDPRLFVIALPTSLAVDTSGAAATADFNSYRGASSGTILAALNDSTLKGYFSLPDYNTLFTSKEGTPAILMGAAEVNFSIAEAINRGWVNEDGAVSAVRYYQAGITAAMQFSGITEERIVQYLQQPALLYKGNNAQGLEQILQQKYIAFFQNSSWEAFYNQRRTGIPEFNVGPFNKNGGKIPLRWNYPQSEYLTNYNQLKRALQSQYQGADNLNGEMWLIK